MNERPSWLKKRLSINVKQDEVSSVLKELRLNTVCESALCPNIAECFAKGTATFMILGNVCTRNCYFCAVPKGEPVEVDEGEPLRIACATKKLRLRHVVITSVTRDDLPDGGSEQFAKTIYALRSEMPEVTIEVLTPDFMGDVSAISKVVSEGPDVFNHNVETVPRLYTAIRPMANYRRSLDVLKKVKELNPHIYTKSGMMLGLGETRTEVSEVIHDLKEAGCDILTIGQYLSPTKDHFPVKEYVHPETFFEIAEEAKKIGFKFVASSPFIRSSFNAMNVYSLIKAVE